MRSIVHFFATFEAYSQANSIILTEMTQDTKLFDLIAQEKQRQMQGKWGRTSNTISRC